MKNILFIFILVISKFVTISSFAQKCLDITDLGNHLATQITANFPDADSLNLTLFVRFKIDSSGSLDSLWVNGEELFDVDYDKYIKNTDAESIKIIYSLQKKYYQMSKLIFTILKDKNFNICMEHKYDGLFLLPIIADFRSVATNYHISNHFDALKNLIDNGITQYYFLEPVKAQRPCKTCL